MIQTINSYHALSIPPNSRINRRAQSKHTHTHTCACCTIRPLPPPPPPLRTICAHFDVQCCAPRVAPKCCTTARHFMLVYTMCFFMLLLCYLYIHDARSTCAQQTRNKSSAYWANMIRMCVRNVMFYTYTSSVCPRKIVPERRRHKFWCERVVFL